MRYTAIGAILCLTTFGGAGLSQETAGANSNHPDWSPDGRSIIFASDVQGQDDLFVMGANGAGRSRVLGGPLRETYPTFSSDGEQFAYIVREESRFTIWTAEADGSDARRLVNEGSSYEPRYSPDGRLLVYTSVRDGDADIYLFDLASGVERLLVKMPGPQGFPSFSPDGREVIFQSRAGEYNQLFTIGLDGSGLSQITDFDANSMHGHVSPDGQWITFDSDRTSPGNIEAREIYVMSRDGDALQRLTRNNARDGYPKWSPDGRHIAFHSARDGQFEIYVMDADGTNQTRLTGPSPQD